MVEVICGGDPAELMLVRRMATEGVDYVEIVYKVGRGGLVGCLETALQHFLIIYVFRQYLSMYKAKAYSVASATSPFTAATIQRRKTTERDVQIEILF